MDFIEYQARCRDTAQYPQSNQVEGLTYAVMGMSGEAGEICNKFKKVLRGDFGDEIKTLPHDVIKSLADELGDVQWYISEISFQLGIPLEEIAAANIAKLAMRKQANKIKGSGDYR